MPLENVQYRSVIRFLFMKGKRREEVIADLNEVYGDDCPSTRTIFRWYSYFQGGRTSVCDEERPGRPPEIQENFSEKLQKIVKSERKITTRELTSRLNVSKGTIYTSLKEAGIRKLCSRFVPRFLTAEMQSRRLECCLSNLDTFESVGELFLDNIITMDETPVSLYVPQSRRESQEWKLPGESSTKKMRQSTSHRKTFMLTIFWDANGIILCDFAENGVKINSAYYSDLVQRCRKLRRKSKNIDLYYLHDNAPIHTSIVSSATIDACGFHTLPHPPYSPDLAPSDFFLFNHLKKALRGQQFATKEELRDSVSEFFDGKDSKYFKKAFQDLVNRWKKCVAANGNYFEK